jgi:GTPase SAR1 family protein
MAESIENKVIRSLKAACELYHRLVLIVGESGSGKTAVIQSLAKSHSTSPININLSLSTELLELTDKQRQLKLSKILAQVVNNASEIVYLDNTEILFDIGLKQDPLRLLQGLSRNFIVVATWNGCFDNGKLTYAAPGHSEYRSYDLTETLVVSMSSEATVDYKHSREDKVV